MAKRKTRLNIDLSEEERKWISMAAAVRNISMGEYVLNAIRVQLANDLHAFTPKALNAKEDPVLAELWDNEKDAVYDEL
jgi:uncharacterized protein (DUF1778 family)